MSLREEIAADLAVHSHRGGLKGFVVTLVFSPGFATIFLHRIACALARRGRIGRLLGKLVWRWNTERSGCYLSLKSTIGPGLQLPHAIAVVVGDGALIGRNVTLYQSVTLGTPVRNSGLYPVIGDGVTIFAGSIVSGGVKVGKGATIGANSYVARDVPAGAVVAGSPARDTRKPPTAPVDDRV